MQPGGVRSRATGSPGLAALTDQPRYRELARRYGPVVADSGTCGCHVHVGVPSRDLGVQVLARLRPWLAPLLAVTANSPIADGRDTAWAAGGTSSTHAGRRRRRLRCGRTRSATTRPSAASSRRALRWTSAASYVLVRLSPRYPTVEVRVADVCLDVGTAVLVAGLTRALVATALAEARQHAPLPAAPARHVNAALAAAARHGLSGPAIDSFTGQPASARSVRSRLIDHLYPALSDHGDGPIITGLLRRLDQDGTGADRQRALFASGLPPPRFVQALARATLSHNM